MSQRNYYGKLNKYEMLLQKTLLGKIVIKKYNNIYYYYYIKLLFNTNIKHKNKFQIYWCMFLFSITNGFNLDRILSSRFLEGCIGERCH